MLESRIEQSLVRGVRKAGGWALKLVSPGHAGVPDRLVLLPGGRVLFVELKQDTGVLSPLQIETHKRLRRLGMKVYTLYGREDVKEFLRKEVMPDAVQTASVSGSRKAVDTGA